MNKSTFTAQLRIEAIVADAQKELTNFGNSLKNAWQGGEPPKSLMRTYEEMRVRLESLKQISEKGLVDTSDLRQAENDFKAFQKDIHNLTVEFKLMSTEQKRAMLSTEEQTAMKARTAAVKEYTDAIKKNQDVLKQRKPLEEQRATVIKEQEPRRTQLRATLADVEARKARLDDRGPVYNKVAEQYAANAEKAKTYTARIKNLELKPALSKKDAETLETYKNALKEIDLITGKADWEEAHRRHSEEVDKAKNIIEATTKEMEEMDSTIRKLDGQLEKLKPVDETEQLNKLKERLKELGVEGIDDAKDIDALRKAIQQLDDKAFARVEQSLKDMNAGLSAMGAEALQVGKEIDASTEAIERQNEALRNQEAFEGRIKQFLGMTGAVELLRRSMVSAFNTIKELDAAMTEMAVVTDIDISGYWDQLPEYTARANELGLTIKDVYQADTLFYQQGLKTNEVIELSTQTMRMARVAGLDTAEATDRMTAALRGFNMELNETNAQKIADVYSELAAITASDVDEISSAMTKTASIAASAGMEFETTAAFLSQIIETTRESAETAGTALKTVIARFQELKKDPAEIGEVDGEIVDANKIETALRSVGVALRDSSGQFRDLDDVFLELAKKWDSLDKNTQRYIATIAAGSRQQSRFIAMMSDYGRTQELVSAATNSAGANQEQFEKTMESLSAKLNKLQNAWNEFSMGILESDLVKAGVDILTTFLKVINKATSAFDGLGGSIMKIITVIGMFNMAKKIFAKIKQPIIGVFSDIVVEAYKKGHEAAKNYTAGAEKGAKEAEKKTGKPESHETKEEKRGFGDITGISDFKQGSSVIRIKGRGQKTLDKYAAAGITKESLNTEIAELAQAENKIEEELAHRKAVLEQAKKELAEIEKEKASYKPNSNRAKKLEKTADQKRGKISYEESQIGKKGQQLDDTKKKQKELTKEVKTYQEAETNAAISSEEAWKQVGEGVAKAGQAIAGLGIGISMIGGLFEELGLEEIGKGFSTVGNIVTMAGTAFSALGTIVPLVAKAMAAAGYTVQSAWWPLLVIGLALAAVVAIVAGIVSAIKAAEAAKLENRMKAAAKATEEAKQAAQEAEDAYDGLLSTWDKYKDTQDGLEDLVVGTTEWKKALHQANQEVLDLIKEYPELQKWVRRTSEGRLEIAEEGWKELENKQLEILNNTELMAMQSSLNKKLLDIEAVESTITSGGIQKVEKKYKEDMTYDERQEYANKAMWYDEGEYYQKTSYDAELVKEVQEQFKRYFQEEGRSLDEALIVADQVAEGYGTSSEQLGEMVTQIYNSLEDTERLQDERAAIAETYLSQIASNTTKESDQYDNIVSFYGNYTASEEHQQKITDTASAIGKASWDDLADNDFYGALLTKYEVADARNNMENMKALYTKMTGKTDAGEKTYEELAKAIAEMGLDDQIVDNMTAISQTLAGLSGESRGQIGALLGDNGTNLTKDMVNNLYKNGIEGELDKTALEKYFTEAGLTLKGVAETMGVEVDTLVEQIEANTRKSYKIQTNAMARLNAARKKHIEGEVADQEKFSNLSISQTAAIANKLTDLLATSGRDLSGDFEDIVVGLGDKADMFTAYISSINWSDKNALEKAQADIEAMGFTWTGAIENFIKAASEAAHAVTVINFETLNQGLKDTYDLLEQLRSGGQNREFEKESYEQLIKADGSLAKDFVQVGDKFVYVGTSMDRLIEALDKNTYSVIEDSKHQYQQQSTMATTLTTGDGVSVGGQTFSVSATSSSDLERDQQVVYLQGIRDQLLEEVRAGNLTEDALSYVTGSNGQSLGLTFTTDFTTLSDEMLAAAVDGFQSLALHAGDYLNSYADAQRESRILGYMQNTAAQNATNAAELGYKTTEGKEYVEALVAQAVQSGGVAEAVIEKYQKAIEDNDTDSISKYEAQIIRGINTSIKNQEQLQELVDLQNQVAEMLYNERQREIDKLSAINDSINETNAQLLSKIQEQIDNARQERENEKAEQNIADLEAQRAYLMAAGGDATQIASLDKQITESKEGYQDSVIDQELTKIQDANEKAAEQRERQIQIAEQQLQFDQESGKLAAEADKIIKDSLTKINAGEDPINTSIGKLFAKDGNWNTLTTEQRDIAKAGFTTLITNAANIASALGGTGIDKDEDGNDVQIPPKMNTGAGVAGNIQEAIDQSEIKNKENRDNAVDIAAQVIEDNAIKGGDLATGRTSSAYQDAKADYIRAGGLASGFDTAVMKHAKLKDGVLTGLYKSGTYSHEDWAGDHYGHVKGNLGNDLWYSYVIYGVSQKDAELKEIFGTPSDQTIVLYNGEPYIYAAKHTEWGTERPAGWRAISMNANQVKSKAKEHLNAYKTGGLADFTGPAWLDGTKSHPELVLNQRDTANFIQLKDILAHVLDRTGSTTNNTSSGDNYYEIEINVDSIEGDYDVEQMADKIRDMIYKDATYRNVNAVNQKK